MILAWDNKGDVAVVTAGSQIATLPGSNVQTPHLSKKWHTAVGVNQSQLLFDMGKHVDVSRVAVLGANLGALGRMRLRASPSVAAVTTDVVYDSGIVQAAGLKALYLPGSLVLASGGNFASTPDSNELVIENNSLTIIFKGATRWTRPSGGPRRALMAQFQEPGNGRVFNTFLYSTGFLDFIWSPDGINTFTLGSSAAIVANDFEQLWIKVEFQANDGAGGKWVKFWYSRDYDPYTEAGTWLQLGATVTQAGTTAIANAIGPKLTVGAFRDDGGDDGNGNVWEGYIYFAELRDGIGTREILARFDPNDAAVGATSFTSSLTRETWTINRSGPLQAAIVTQPSASLKDGYGALHGAVANAFLKSPGTAGGNYASTPDTATVSVTGDIDIRIKVGLHDWSPQTRAMLCSKHTEAGNQRSWTLALETGGTLAMYHSNTGVADAQANSGALGFASRSTWWVRFTRRVSDGRCQFFYASDYDPKTRSGTWTQTVGGDTFTLVGLNLFDSDQPLRVGAFRATGDENPRGEIYYFELLNGIDGTVVASFDPSRASATGATSIVAATGETWTINQSGTRKAEIVKNESVRARYWRLDLADNSLPDNLQVGRVFLGPSWTHAKSLLYGWGITPQDPSPIVKSRGGQSYPDTLPKFRVGEFAFDYLTEAEIYDNLFAMARANGVVKGVLAIPLEDGAYVSEQAIWGLVSVSEPVMHRLSRTFRQKFRIEERL